MSVLQSLKPCVGKYKKFAILTPLLVVLEVAFEVLIPLVIQYLINEIDTVNGGQARLEWVAIYGAIIFAMCGGALLTGAFAGKTAAIASTGFAANTRQKLYSRIQTYSFSNLDKYPTSTLVTRLTTDITNVQSAFQMLIRMTVRAPIMLIFATTMSFVLNWRLALIFVVAIPFVVLGFGFIMKKAFPNFDAMFKKYDKLNESVEENLAGIRVVKSYVREEYEEAKFRKASDEVKKFSIKAEGLLAWGTPIMMIAMYGCILALYWFGGLQMIDGMKAGTFTSFMTYGMQILMSMMMVAMVIVMLVMARASAARISQAMEEVPDISNPENPVTEVSDGSVCFKNVTFDYDTTDDKEAVLLDLDIKIPSGQMVGILGGTGSGKTSLVQLIPRLYDTTEGEVEVGGRNVREYDLKVLRDNVAMVLQKNVLFSGTIEENLRWGNPDATAEEIDEACRSAQAYDFIQGMPNGYQTELGQGGVNVSGGQKQRLCIARALLKHPKIMILDDSTSAVDTKTDAHIRAALRKEKDITKIIIAQRISSIEDADQIIVLNDGKVVAQGTHDDLLKSCSIYQEVYHSQTKSKAGEGVANV